VIAARRSSELRRARIAAAAARPVAMPASLRAPSGTDESAVSYSAFTDAAAVGTSAASVSCAAAATAAGTEAREAEPAYAYGSYRGSIALSAS
jgi:hypothetical protein